MLRKKLCVFVISSVKILKCFSFFLSISFVMCAVLFCSVLLGTVSDCTCVLYSMCRADANYSPVCEIKF